MSMDLWNAVSKQSVNPRKVFMRVKRPGGTCCQDSVNYVYLFPMGVAGKKSGCLFFFWGWGGGSHANGFIIVRLCLPLI